jgi:hypothetical protein
MLRPFFRLITNRAGADGPSGVKQEANSQEEARKVPFGCLLADQVFRL